MVRTFEDLDCWKLAAALRRRLTQLTKDFPKEERFQLVDQIRRASRSVTANIAEGYGRFHYQEYIQFCRQSRGSLYEIMDHLIVANEEGYIVEAQLQDLKAEVLRCIAVLNGFIKYLGNAKSKSQNLANEPIVYYNTSHD